MSHFVEQLETIATQDPSVRLAAQVQEILRSALPSDATEQSFEAIFRLFERFPQYDFGTPCPLVYWVEQHYPRYLPKLRESIQRCPTEPAISLVCRALIANSDAATGFSRRSPTEPKELSHSERAALDYLVSLQMNPARVLPDEYAIWEERAPESKYRAPNPMLLCGQRHLQLAYLIDAPPAEGLVRPTGRTTELTEGHACCILHFREPSIHMFRSGGGNDALEALDTRGVKLHALYRIAHSRWARSHGNLTHFFFMFHDSTFECVAKSYTVEIAEASVSCAIRAAVAQANT